MMTSDPSVVVLDSESNGNREAKPILSPVSVVSPGSSVGAVTPLDRSMVAEGSDFSLTPTPVKRAGTDISNLQFSTPKRPKQVRTRRSPAEVEREKKEREERRVERLKLAEEARQRKDEEQKKKEEARLKREEARQFALKAKQEEKDRKDEERRKKEEEKKSLEDQKLKVKEAKTQKQEKVKNHFLSFFKSPAEKSPQPVRRVALTTTTSRFQPMLCQPGMTIAPILRRPPVSDTTILDRALQLGGVCDSPLYLAELAERVNGQCFHLTASKRSVASKPGMCPKMLQFKENQRPAYWGTWRKKSKSVRPRNPLGQDEALDYEYDSEAEWEEDEPGESLSDSEGEDKEEGGGGGGGDEDDEEDDGFFVPHGYLSDDERGGSDLEQELDPSATALLRKVSQGPVISGPELLAKFPFVPLLSQCPLNPMYFALPSSAPLRFVVY